jgi:hypothetical protein
MQIIDTNTVRLHAQLTEPVRSVDGSLLGDLHHTTIYGRTGDTTAVLVTNPATAPSGGGTVTLDVLVNAPSGVVTSWEFWATATDLAGNEGPSSNTVTLAIDRIGPAAPTGFTVG